MALDTDFWSARMAYLAKLARTDALAVVLPVRGEGYATYVGHNSPADPSWGRPEIRPLLDRALEAGTREQAADLAVPLADGRDATAAFVTPISWQGRVIGALAGFREAGPLPPADVPSFDRVAELIALELAEANALWRAQRSQRDAETRLRVTREIQSALGEQRDPDRMLELATAQLAEIFGADGVSIMLADEKGELSVRSSLGLSDAAKKERRRLGEGISGYVAKTGQPLHLTGPIRDERFTGTDPNARESLVAPLRAGDRTLGVVNVKHRAGAGRYGQAQLDSLSQMAGDIASALTMADALRQAEADRQQALVLYELSRFATLGEDPQADLENAIALLGDTLGHEVVGVWQLAEGDVLRLRASRGYGPLLPNDLPRHEAGERLDAVLRDRAAARVTFAPDAPRPAWAPERATSFIVAPIGGVSRLAGCLVLGRETGSYGPEDAEFAMTLGEYLSGMVRKWTATDAPHRAAVDERQRIAQELHEGIAQEITGIVLGLEASQRALRRDPDLVRKQLAKAVRDARASLADLRQFMAALRQSETGRMDLPFTANRLLEDLRRQSGLEVELEQVGVERELAPHVERAVIRVLGEALRNVALHSQATSAKLTVRYDDDAIVVWVQDDGVGFDVVERVKAAEEAGHFGVTGMRERAEGVGGTLTVRSEPGRGSLVIGSFPYAGIPAALATLDDEPAVPAGAEAASPGADLEEEQHADRGGLFGRLFGR